MPSYRAVKVEIPSVAGGGLKLVPKCVHYLTSMQSSFVGGLFLAALTEYKGKTLSHGIFFLRTLIQHLLCSRCFWSWANTGCNPEFWFLELGCCLQKHSFILLADIWFEKCAATLCERGRKRFAVFLRFFLFSCWKASEFLVGSMSCGCPGTQGCAYRSACRWESSLIRKEEWVRVNQ